MRPKATEKIEIDMGTLDSLDEVISRCDTCDIYYSVEEVMLNEKTHEFICDYCREDVEDE